MTPWSFVSEHELVPYAALQTLPAASLLVLAPHPDDETFGCGGTVARACDALCQVTIVVATDGGKGGDAVVREAEARRAVQALAGAGMPPQLQFWRLADRELSPDNALVSRIAALAAERGAPWLLAPSPFEVHPDHRALCVAAIEAAERVPVRLGFYEIGQPLVADTLVDITPVMPRKRAAMACYPSQMAAQRYDEQVEGMNRLRAYTLGPSVRFAEAFWFPQGPAGVRGVLADAQQRLARRLGLADGP